MHSRAKRICLNSISAILTVLIMTASFFAIYLFLFNIVYIGTPVRGMSMYPTLNANVESSDTSGDYVYINPYREMNINDIVVADVDWNNESRYVIKRLVGTPGDQIQIVLNDEMSEFSLKVNGETIYTLDYSREFYNGSYMKYVNFINSDSSNVGLTPDGERCIELHDDEYFLMGDNWDVSLDCLSNGPVASDDIVGVVDVVIPYKSNKFTTLVSELWGLLF